MSHSSNKTDATRGEEPRSLASSDLPLRGVFVHRMGENTADEQRVAEFWRAHGVEADAMEDPAQRYSKLADLRLSRDRVPWAYCEVKTITPHHWKIRILHEGQPAEERVEAGNQPLQERLTGDLVTAIRQLSFSNPNHSLLNFVVLVNRDAQASPSLVTRLLSASPATSGRSLKVRRSARLAEEAQSFRRKVDLCLWVNPATDGALLIEKCFLFNPSLRSFAEEITGMRADKLVSLEPAA
jgi:hypothetical protein